MQSSIQFLGGTVLDFAKNQLVDRYRKKPLPLRPPHKNLNLSTAKALHLIAKSSKPLLVIILFLLSNFLQAQVVINEIMWDELQYLELYNNSGQPVNLSNWTISNKNGLLTTLPNVNFPAGGYFLIEEDEAATFIPSDHLAVLNLGRLTGDHLSLKDAAGLTVDVANRPGMNWFAGMDSPSGVSMERENPDLPGDLSSNWGNSTGNLGGRNGTPGEKNSLLVTSQSSFLIKRVNFRNPPDWVEILCLSDGNNGGGLDIANYYITDLANPDKVIDNVTIRSGETLKITYNSSEPDETSSADGNRNGILDLYTTVNGLVSTDEQIVFVDDNDQFLDAVCWSDGVLANEEAADLNELFLAGEWDSNKADSCIDSRLVVADKLLERKGNEDSNSAADWIIADSGTYNPGTNNDAVDIEPSQSAKISTLKIKPNPVWLDDNNPGKRKAAISFYLANEAKVTAVIYDTAGRLIRKIKRGESMPGGDNQLFWRGRDEFDNSVPVGIYILYLKTTNDGGADQKVKTIVIGRKN